MYHKHYTKRFQKSFKKIIHSGKIKRLEVESIINILASGQKLAPKHQDHLLHGSLDNLRECHVKGDLLLIYYIKNQELVLVLFDIGSHSELF
ncbi:type II toxin-antitoxin system YafQ family toxin [Candidatus Nomurabacteria bacterium]|nr:type II toxin-antitoxin system YafQ family toxin [Candidatus Nomurabacteria bacterium]